MKHVALPAILGGLGALGPLAIDMYLPAMPSIATSLGASQTLVQFSLMAFFMGLTFGQLIHGPVSDHYGRRPTTIVALAVFIVSSIGCAFAVNAGGLVGRRFFQGIGGSVGIVVGLSVTRDLYTGREAARLLALIMTVVGIAPIVAPVVGISILSLVSWRGLFFALAAFGLFLLIAVAFAFPETRSSEMRGQGGVFSTLKAYRALLFDRRFMPYVLAMALAQAGFFAYIASSSFVFITLYGFSPSHFALIFALNAFGLILGGQAGPRLTGLFSFRLVVRSALACHFVASGILVALLLSGLAGWVSVPPSYSLQSQAWVLSPRFAALWRLLIMAGQQERLPR